MRVAVVGASVAGVAACEAVRAAGFDGELVLIGDEDAAPYDRPPLSKQLLLGAVEPDGVALREPGALEALGVRERRGRAAVALHAPDRELELAGGERLRYDGLVVATGSRARRLPDQPDAPGVHVLRTLADALAVRERLRAGARRVVVVGAGFIGLEVASCALQHGCAVTVLEAAPEPMGRLLSAPVGRLFAALHRGRGIDVRCDAHVAELLVDEGGARGVRLAGGELLEADLVIVGVGAAPNVDWLAGSGLQVEDGVLCDAHLRAGPGTYAAGDVARWAHPLFGMIRVEHWTTAGHHARTAAVNLVAELAGAPERLEAAEVPYFWSDQLGLKVQMTGWSPISDRTSITVEGARVLVLFGRGDRLVAAMAWGWPKALALHRRKVANATDFEDAVAEAPGEPIEPDALLTLLEQGFPGPAPAAGAGNPVAP